MELNDLVHSVEKAIHDLGVDPAQARGEEQGQWLLMRNETPIYLDAWSAEQKSPWNYFIFEEDATTFQLTIPFCYAPTLQREAFLDDHGEFHSYMPDTYDKSSCITERPAQ
ncbi:MAG: hypothetical protein EBS08_06515 [Cytophagia bacterium]|nr:hypothetical protein [Cytophagia bacterium]